MLWYLFSFVFYLTPSNHLKPEIRFFFFSFLSKANFPRQTQRQKLPLFPQRAIVVKPAINPLKSWKKNLFYKLHARVNIWTPWQSTIFENFTRAYSWKTCTYSFLEASILFDSLNYSLGWSQRNYQKNPKQSPQKVPKILKMCVVFPSPQVLSSPCSNLTLSEKKRPKSWKMSPSPDDIVTQYFVTL